MVNNFLAGNGKNSTAKRIRPASDPLFLGVHEKGEGIQYSPAFHVAIRRKNSNPCVQTKPCKTACRRSEPRGTVGGKL